MSVVQMDPEDQDFLLVDSSDIRDFNEEGILPLSHDKFAEIQAWLAPTEYSGGSSEYGKHQASHLEGTGMWLFEKSEYRQWYKSSSGALWIKAMAGAGKSVIAASLITRLTAEKTVPVLYFFFRHIVSANQKPQSLVRDYMSQALQFIPILQHSLYVYVKDRRSLDSVSLDELWLLLTTALAQLPRVYCVIDALDEMDVGNNFFLQNLLDLTQARSTSIKVCMTSRPVPHVERVLRDQSVLKIALQPQIVDPDISVYVKYRLTRSFISADLQTQIHEKMCVKSDGHFLYARLMMDDLLESQKTNSISEPELKLKLNSLPKPMAGMYSRMLRNHSQQSGISQELQVQLLQWVTRAERPIRVLELSSMIDSSQQDISLTSKTKSMVREGCGPLLEILADETVCPIHHSLTEYLYDKERAHEETDMDAFPTLSYEQTQRNLAVTCIRLLSCGWHNDLPDSVLQKGFPGNFAFGALRLRYPFLEYAATNWYIHLRKSGANDVVTMDEVHALLIKDPALCRVWPGLDMNRIPRPGIGKRYNCSSTWTPLHIAADVGIEHFVEHLICTGHDIESLDGYHRTPLALASAQGHDSVVALLLMSGAKNDLPDAAGFKPMHQAARNNHSNIVKLLLNSGVDPVTPKTKEDPGRRCGNAPKTVGDTPVKYACRHGHIETVEAFIPHLKKEDLQMALYWAVRFGQTKLATLLLQIPSIDVNSVIRDQTLLYLASHARDVGVMRLLLDLGADVQALSSDYASNGGAALSSSSCMRSCNPLHGFVKANRDFASSLKKTNSEKLLFKQGVEMLLDAGLNLDSSDSGGLTVLHHMLRSRIWGTCTSPAPELEDILVMLLKRGLQVSALTPDGSNALHLASSNISIATIDILIDGGIDIDLARNSDGRTALMLALERHDVAVAQHLLSRGANVNLADNEGNTSLHWIGKYSAHASQTEMARNVIAAGVVINAKNKLGKTWLHLDHFKPELLDLALQNGFDLEAKDREGRTLLSNFVFDDVAVKLLLEAGANVHTFDNKGATLLHILLETNTAYRSRTIDRIHFWIKKGISPLAVDNSGNTLWHSLVQQRASRYTSEQTAIMEFLVEVGVPQNSKNYSGQTPLHLASCVQNDSISPGPIDFLLKSGQINVNVADHDRIMPLHITASWCFNMTALLLNLGSDAMASTLQGQTPLMIATRARQCNTVWLLLDHYNERGKLSLIDRTDNAGRTALHYACRSGRPETVALLLQAGANPNVQDKKGLTPLCMCAEYLTEQASWNVLEPVGRKENSYHAAHIMLDDTSRPRSSDQLVPTNDPVRIRESIRNLINKGANTSFLTTIPETKALIQNPLWLAISNACQPMISELLSIQDELLQLNRQIPGMGLLSSEKLSESLHSNDVVGIKAYWNNVLNRYEHRVRRLGLRHLKDVIPGIVATGNNTLSLVQSMLEKDDEPAIEEVSRLKVSLLELDDHGRNPLFQMASWGYADLLRKVGRNASLMNADWTRHMTHLNPSWKEGRLRTILWTAISRTQPNLDVVKVLISDFMMDPNELIVEYSSESIARSVIHRLAMPQHLWQVKALEFLLENGAQVDLLDSNQETPLIVALRRARDGSSIACNVLSIKAVETLLDHGANSNAVDQLGLTCLNIASKRANCLRLLLRSGADPSLGMRPLIFDLIEAQDVDMIEQISKSGANMNVLSRLPPALEAPHYRSTRQNLRVSKTEQDSDQAIIWSDIRSSHDLSKVAYPIHVAASRFFSVEGQKQNASKIIEILLNAGADPYLSYGDGNTILHLLAEQAGIIEPFLLHPSFDMECKDVRGRTLLLAACDARLDKVGPSVATLPTLLIDNRAIITASDNLGRNALHCLIAALPSVGNSAFSFIPILAPFLPVLTTKPDGQNRTPFHYAISMKRFDLIDSLLLHGADPSILDPLDGSVLLHHLAGELANIEDVALYEPEAAETARNRLLLYPRYGTSKADDSLRSPQRHFLSCLASGLSINARDNAGNTPLFRTMTTDFHSFYTPESTQFVILQMFEQQGANFIARNNKGESLLHILATQHLLRGTSRRAKYEEVTEDLRRAFQWLVTKGIDVTWEDVGGRTCLDVAAATGAEWVLDMYKRV